MSHKDDINVLSGRLHRIIGLLCDLDDDLGIIYDELGAQELTLGVQERTCNALPQISDTVCVVRRGGMEIEFGYWTCSECGCENFAGAKFCMVCGAKVVEA